MTEGKSTTLDPERAIAATLLLPGSAGNSAVDPTAEIQGLASAAGAQVVACVVQRKESPNPRAAFGKGKIEELRLLCQQEEASLLIVDFDLSPSQARNLEKDLGVRVVDRTELILDIFSTRARSRQAKLQVELAQLQYLRSRLRRMWTHLERTGAMIGTRGPGETQLESDRRLIDQKITELKRRLRTIENRSLRSARNRLDPNTVSLVGYTNAGKSSLLVHLTGAEAYIADQLFATLDTRLRYWKLKDRRRVMLADTVGFVRELPHHLVASFHATLEETLHADLLLHVIDANDPDRHLNYKAVQDVLQDLNAVEIPTVLVLNKADLLTADERLTVQAEFPDAVFLSAKTGEGIEQLDRIVAAQLDIWALNIEVVIPSGSGKLLSELRRVSRIEFENYQGSNWHARLRIGPRHWAMLQAEFGASGGQMEVVIESSS